MTRLKQRKRPRMGVRPDPKAGREWPTHRAFVRKHECIVPGCKNDDIEACHVRKGLPPEDKAGKGEKPPDWWCFAACALHHREQHTIGEPQFERKYAVDLKAAAEWLASHTTDKKMIEARKDG